jgi:hypothetical protein
MAIDLAAQPVDTDRLGNVVEVLFAEIVEGEG